MARLQTESVRRMRPMLEIAQQTMPKSVDNNVLNSLNFVSKAGAGLAMKMRPADFSKMEAQTNNVMAVLSHMDMRQRALNNQQKLAQSQYFSDHYGSIHAEKNAFEIWGHSKTTRRDSPTRSGPAS